jgi:hypothetical protein
MNYPAAELRGILLIIAPVIKHMKSAIGQSKDA